MIRQGTRAKATVAVVAATAIVGSAAAAVAPAQGAAPQRLAASADAQHRAPRGLTAQGPGTPRVTQLRNRLPRTGRYAFLLRLDTRSTLDAGRAVARQGRTAARAAGRAQLRTVVLKQNSVVAELPSGSSVLYRTHAALAGLAVVTDVRNYTALTKLSGVTAVYPIAPKSPSNSYAVPLQKAPQAWTAYGDLGANSTIAIIDTGIDYTHANFGGPGTVAAYKAAHAAEAAPADPALYPNKKVIGGYDLVGDHYNADPNADPSSAYPYNPVPAPDTNPLDCGGHGSHVAGSAAGYGENANGSTYTGAYNSSTPFNTMRIGPGVAPEAKLYAFRVFGCDGSTDVVGAAIDRAADPNGDGDTSDHVDVINMSLGSDFGSPQDGDAVISNDASALGIDVVIASGNAGDVYDTGGSPGDAPRPIAVAASSDAQSVVDSLVVSAPQSIAGTYPAERSIAYDYDTKPDLSGAVARVTQPGNLDGCDPLNTTDKAAVAGKIAFVEWTDDDTTRRCGSVARSKNLSDAGAIGFIFGDDEENFAAGITGSDKIPGVLVAKSGADKIRTELVANHPVQISGTVRNGSVQQDPSLDDTIASFSSRGIRGAGNSKPDVAAVGSTVFSTSVGTGTEGQTDSGTSMATPMVAGEAALVNSQHPDWTPEQVKADIMNTAGQDVFTQGGHTGEKYAPNRVGAGRIDVKAALDNDVLAYSSDDAGVVSVSFGSLALTGPYTRTKHIKVQNMTLGTRTYSVSYEGLTSIPGVTYTVSPSSVTLSPRGSQIVSVKLSVDASKLTKTIDPTADRVQGYPRDYVADASGRVLLTSSGHPQLRVPVYSAPRPASTMTQPKSVTLPHGSVQSALLPLSGKQVKQGSGLEAIRSTVAGFELTATSGRLPRCTGTSTNHCIPFADARAADLKYLGVTSSAPQEASIGNSPKADGFLYFAVSAQGPWRTQAGIQEYDILLDVNRDKQADFVVYNTRITDTDVMLSELVDLATGTVVDDELINDRFGNYDTALFDSDTLVLPVWIAKLGLGKNSRINYGIASFSAYSNSVMDSIGLTRAGNPTGALSVDPLHPGVAVYGSYDGTSSPLLYRDSPGSVLKVRRDAGAYRLDHGLGALIVHFHNLVGSKAQVTALKTAPTVSLSFKPGTVGKGKRATTTITVAPSSGLPATGRVRLIRLTGPHAPYRVAGAALRDGKATFAYTNHLAKGTYKYRAEYLGDANYVTGHSGTVTLRIS
jgi:subtilisin family serine protease